VLLREPDQVEANAFEHKHALANRCLRQDSESCSVCILLPPPTARLQGKSTVNLRVERLQATTEAADMAQAQGVVRLIKLSVQPDQRTPGAQTRRNLVAQLLQPSDKRTVSNPPGMGEMGSQPMYR
jgi:hypothetical protein